MCILCYLYTKIKTFSYFLLNDVKTSSTAAFLLPVSSWNYIKYTYFCLFFQNKSWFTKTHILRSPSVSAPLLWRGVGGSSDTTGAPQVRTLRGGRTGPQLPPCGLMGHTEGLTCLLLISVDPPGFSSFTLCLMLKLQILMWKQWMRPHRQRQVSANCLQLLLLLLLFVPLNTLTQTKTFFFFKLIRVNVRSLHLWLHSNTTFNFLFFFLKTPCSDLNVS